MVRRKLFVSYFDLRTTVLPFKYVPKSKDVLKTAVVPDLVTSANWSLSEATRNQTIDRRGSDHSLSNMTGDQKRNKRPFHLRKGKFGDKKSRLKVEDNEIKSLQDRYHTIQPGNIQKFTDFPLCSRTQKGLKQAEYVSPTDIQRQSIGLALQGHDILGAAKTGSGKTLAFLIPILECLFRQKWSAMDGLGALIISPTRELAYQTFEVLQKVGKTHDFSAGLVIGGKHLREEAERINRTNIVICTPGRFLQHMDETPLFNADQLQMLVLDEADRILDLGFRDTLNAIIENLPPERQTLLFSATQTRSVKDLARLSLKSPVYVSVHENAKFSTPTGLQQSYMVCELHEKMDLLWSFVKSHLKKKVLIFLQSCKQVRYMHESLRKLRPGVTVLGLHGAMNQMKRMAVYDQFCRKQSVCLLATDIAARGLDFPEVDWVVQLDCPEDANTYIHRAGRTARFQKDGEALLVLLPTEEEAMIKQLDDKKIPIEQIRVNPKKQWTIQGKLEGLCAADVTHKQYAQRAFMSYLRSVFLMKNKQVFDVHKLDTAKYARSLGLAIAPRVRFLQRALARQAEAKDSKTSTSSLIKKPVDREAMPSLVDDSEDEGDSDGDESGDDFLTVKSRIEPEPRDAAGDESEEEEAEKMNETKLGSTNKTQRVVTKAALAKKLQKKNIVANTRITFDEYGEQMDDPATKSRLQDVSDDEDTGGGINIDKAKQHMREQDKIDRQLFKQKVKEKHKEEKRKKKEQRKAAMEQSDESEDEEMEVTLGNPDDAEDEVSESDAEESDDEVQAEDDAESEEDDDDSDDDDSDEEDDDNSEEDESDEETPSVPRKRPRRDPAAHIFSKDSRLEDQEAFALSLLAS